MTKETKKAETEVTLTERRNELNAEFVRLTKLKGQISETLRNIEVAQGELDRIEGKQT